MYEYNLLLRELESIQGIKYTIIQGVTHILKNNIRYYLSDFMEVLK